MSILQLLIKKCTCDTEKLDPNKHKPGCPLRRTMRFPHLFYYETSEDAFTPAPDSVEECINVNDLNNGEEVYIRFKRVDLTDYEFKILPEVLKSQLISNIHKNIP